MHDTPKTGVIMRQVLRSRSSVTLLNQQKSKPKDQLERRTLHIPEKVNGVTQDVARSPKKSFRGRAQQLGLKKSTLHEIFTQDLDLYLYHISTMQVLKPADIQKRVLICIWFERILPHLGDLNRNHISYTYVLGLHWYSQIMA